MLAPGSAGSVAPDARLAVTVAAGLAAAWLVATVGLPLPGAPVLAGAGFVVSVAIAGGTIAFAAIAQPRGLGEALRAHRVVAGAAALVLAAYLLSALAAGASITSLVGCARIAAIGAFAFAVVGANRRRALGEAFAWAAFGLIAVYALLFVLGVTFRALRPFVFLTLVHQHLGGVPRFDALTGTPGSTGAWALLAAGLVGPLRHRTGRRVARVVAALVALASFSAATLVLPAMLAAALIRPLRARVATTGVLAALAVAALYAHVLEVDVGEHQVTVSELHPSYFEGGLGPEQMPAHEVNAVGVKVKLHFTAYAALVARAARCFAEHPLVGVGPRQFPDACPVLTMNTYGTWSAHRSPHNQFAEVGVELGSVGVLLVAVAAWGLRRRMVWEPADRWCRAAAVGIVVYAFSAEVLLTLPVAGFFALYLRPRPSVSE